MTDLYFQLKIGVEIALVEFVRDRGASRGASTAFTQHDPCRASALAWRTGGDDDALLGALQPVDLLFKGGDPLLALAASERLSVCFRAVTGRPSRQLPRLGCAKTGHPVGLTGQ
jgi:hypothetical protein